MKEEKPHSALISGVFVGAKNTEKRNQKQLKTKAKKRRKSTKKNRNKTLNLRAEKRLKKSKKQA